MNVGMDDAEKADVVKSKRSEELIKSVIMTMRIQQPHFNHMKRGTAKPIYCHL